MERRQGIFLGGGLDEVRGEEGGRGRHGPEEAAEDGGGGFECAEAEHGGGWGLVVMRVWCGGRGLGGGKVGAAKIFGVL